MRLPRDLSGRDLAKALRALGYEVTRQTGSHIRLTTSRNGEHHVTIPDHAQLRLGTLASIVRSVAEHEEAPLDDVHRILFGDGR